MCSMSMFAVDVVIGYNSRCKSLGQQQARYNEIADFFRDSSPRFFEDPNLVNKIVSWSIMPSMCVEWMATLEATWTEQNFGDSGDDVSDCDPIRPGELVDCTEDVSPIR